MKFLVTGAKGQLGSDLVDLLSHSATDEVVACDRDDLDITDVASVERNLMLHRPDIVVNCAAWTAVDLAEEREHDALRVNADGPRNIARVCAATEKRLIHISTDYVFDGAASIPYAENATTRPVSAYGRTKRDGELAVVEEHPDGSFIVRTAWLYGKHGNNFVKTMLKMERERDTIEVVDDQIGQPTWSRDLAQQVIAIAQSNAQPGIFHGTNSGATSWYSLAREIFKLIEADPERVRPTDSAKYVRPAPRPQYSVLGHDAWERNSMSAMRSWKAALKASFAAGLHIEQD